MEDISCSIKEYLARITVKVICTLYYYCTDVVSLCPLCAARGSAFSRSTVSSALPSFIFYGDQGSLYEDAEVCDTMTP